MNQNELKAIFDKIEKGIIPGDLISDKKSPIKKYKITNNSDKSTFTISRQIRPFYEKKCAPDGYLYNVTGIEIEETVSAFIIISQEIEV